MRKAKEEKNESTFDLEEAFVLWKTKSKNGKEYLSGKTSNTCGENEIVGFFNTEKKNEKSPDIQIYKRENEELKEICALWNSVSKLGKTYLTGSTSENEKIVAYFNNSNNEKAPYIRGYFKDKE